jgi:ATP-dependent Clp protease ATP-binding subunit ClpA
VLQGAAEEAEGLHHNYIGMEHLLLGLLRVGSSEAASILADYGLQIDVVRATLVDLMMPGAEVGSGSADQTRLVEHLEQLVELLAKAPTNSPQAHELQSQIHTGLERLRQHFRRKAEDQSAWSTTTSSVDR